MPTIYVRSGAATDPQIAGTPPPGVAKIGCITASDLLAFNTDGTIRYAGVLTNAQTWTGSQTFTAPHALNFASIAPSTETDGTIMTTGSTWPSFSTAGQCGIKLLLNDACATGNFATIRARAKSSVARTGTLQYTLAGDFSASAAVSEYKDLIGVSAYGQVPAAYTQTNANHVVCGVKAAITDFTGATSSGSRYALWVDDASINTAANGHYLIFAQKLTGAATIDGVMQVRGDLFTYGLNFTEATFATADIVFQNSDTLSNLVAGTLAVSGKLTAAYTGTAAAASTHRAITGAATTYTSMTSGNLVGVRGSITMGGACSSTAYLYGAQGKAITGANTFSGTALAGVYGQIDVSSGTISSGHVAAIQANIYGANSGTIPMEGLYIEHAGGAVINSLIQMFGKSTYVFDISSNTHTNVSTTGTPGAVTGGTGWIKCYIDGAVRYIPLASSVS